MRRARLVCTLLVLLGLCSCAGVYVVRPGTLKPAVASVAPDQRVATWQRAITVLLDEGYVPQVLDATACYIFAKARDDVAAGATYGAWAMVVVAPDGVVRVTVSGIGLYHSQDELGADVVARQERLIRLIMSRM